MNMNNSEVKTFLNRVEPALLGVISTLDASNYPSTIPVWYRFDGEVINIWTTMSRAWPKHVRRHPKVSFAAMETEPPFAAVLLKGTASLVVNGPDHWAEVRRITERYIPTEKCDAYIESWAVLETICVVTPEKFVTWKKGY